MAATTDEGIYARSSARKSAADAAPVSRSSAQEAGVGSAMPPGRTSPPTQSSLPPSRTLLGEGSIISSVSSGTQGATWSDPCPREKRNGTSSGKASARPTQEKNGQAGKNRSKGSSVIAMLATMALMLFAYQQISYLWSSGGSGQDATTKAMDRKEWGEYKKTLDSLMATQFLEGRQIVARRIVTEALMRNKRQYKSAMLKRAAVFHFGGEGKDDAGNDRFEKMVQVITSFILEGPAPSKGTRPEVLEIGKGGQTEEWKELRRKVHGQVVKHPRSIIVLHRADEAPQGKLYDLEDAFENSEFEYGGKRTDCSKVIFVLESKFAGGGLLAAGACGGKQCSEEHRDAMVRELKKLTQSQWDRQAFVARVREVVPFT